jgi:diguanylate cyclase (GGDEF)-like protein
MPSWWMRCVGPLVTLATVTATWFVNLHVIPVPNQSAITFLAVAFAAYTGGLGAGLVSSAIVIGFAALYFSVPGHFLSFRPDGVSRLIIVLVCAPAVALLMGVLKARTMRALAREREGRLAVEATNRQLTTLSAALDEVNYGVVLLDHELRAVFINKEFRRMWKLPDALADAAPPFVALAYHVRDTGAYAIPEGDLDSYVAERVRLVRVGHPDPVDIPLVNGETVRLRCAVLPTGGRMLSYTHITDLVQRADEWEDLASIDHLTGLFNRRHFLELADKEWSRFDRYARPLSLMMIDIDRFKSINDRHGHDVGDRVLVHVGAICREDMRASDIVARFGGEEFVMLLPETPLESAVVAAERLRRRIADTPLRERNGHIALTASFGVAEAGGRIDSIAALMKTADEALYRAKNAGRDRVVAATADASPSQVALAS